MEYTFKWKRGLFTFRRVVVGHRYDNEQEKMVLFKKDGTVEEVADWKRCAAVLGVDWLRATEKDLERKAGVSIPTAI